VGGVKEGNPASDRAIIIDKKGKKERR
jgi:hypothetical protein